MKGKEQTEFEEVVIKKGTEYIKFALAVFGLISLLITGVWQGFTFISNTIQNDMIIQKDVSINQVQIDGLKKDFAIGMKENDKEHQQILSVISEVHSDIKFIKKMIQVKNRVKMKDSLSLTNRSLKNCQSVLQPGYFDRTDNCKMFFLR